MRNQTSQNPPSVANQNSTQSEPGPEEIMVDEIAADATAEAPAAKTIPKSTAPKS
jgi:hypothetical protein